MLLSSSRLSRVDSGVVLWVVLMFIWLGMLVMKCCNCVVLLFFVLVG